MGRILISAVLVFVTGAMAEDAQKLYDELFGEMEKETLATASKKDDGEFAKVLLESVKSLEDKLDLKILVLGRACDLAVAAGDWQTASRAIELLIQTAPDDRLQWETKRLDICRTRYNTSRGEERKQAAGEYVSQMVKVGDAAMKAGKSKEAMAEYQRAYQMARANKLPDAGSIRERMKEAGAEAAKRRNLEQLEAKLKASPDDPEIQKKLAMEYVLTLDDPAGALKLLGKGGDLELKTYLEVAARPVKELGVDECFELAGWYRDLCKDASSSKKKVAAGRAVQYYNGFLSLYEKKDVKRLKAIQERKKLEPLAGPARVASVKLPEGVIFRMTFDKDSVVKRGERWYLKDAAAKDKDALAGRIRIQPRIEKGIKGEAFGFVGAAAGVISTRGHEMHQCHETGTIGMWAKAAETRSTMSIFHTEECRDRAIYIHGGRFRAMMFTGRVFEVQDGPAADTAWHHLVFSWDVKRGLMFFYVDGRLVRTRKGPPWTSTARGEPTEYGGARPAEPKGDVPARAPFKGLIDEAAVWNRVLSPAEVKQFYSATKD